MHVHSLLIGDVFLLFSFLAKSINRSCSTFFFSISMSVSLYLLSLLARLWWLHTRVFTFFYSLHYLQFTLLRRYFVCRVFLFFISPLSLFYLPFNVYLIFLKCAKTRLPRCNLHIYRGYLLFFPSLRTCYFKKLKIFFLQNVKSWRDFINLIWINIKFKSWKKKKNFFW